MRILIIVIIFFFSCAENTNELSDCGSNTPKITERFIIPDNININKEMIVAAYREMHPQDAYVIIVLNDTTEITATKMSYLNDSIFEVRELVKVYYNEFRLKSDSNEIYIITPTNVNYIHKNGMSIMTAEYPRVDIE